MAVVVNTVRVALSGAIPAGSNVIGGVTQSGAWSVSLSGTANVSVQNATIAVTQSGTWNIGSITTLPALPAGSNVIGAVTQSGTWNVGITGTPTVTLGAGSASVGTVTVGNASIPVTDNGGSLTVDGTVAATQSGTWNINAVTTLPSLVAGSATIGSIASIGTSVTPGTAAANLGKADDAVHSASDVGVMALTVRNDAASTTLVSANNDYSPLSVDLKGRAHVIDRGATITSTSASVTTTSGQIVASATDRRTVVLTNLGTDYVWIGASGVTDNQGIRLAPGQALTIDRAPNAAIHAKAATGTQTVAIFVESD